MSVAAIGTTPAWGWSPSLNLIEKQENEHLHILLLGAFDARHMMQTISKSHYNKITVNEEIKN